MSRRRMGVERQNFVMGPRAAPLLALLAVVPALACGRVDNGAASAAAGPEGGAPSAAAGGASMNACDNILCPPGKTCFAGTCLPPPAACSGHSPQDDARALVIGRGPKAIVIGDWNSDGRADLATANETDRTVSVLLGCGDGVFAPKVDFPTGQSPSALASCDLNADHQPDLVTTSQDYGTLTVLLGNGDGTFVSKGEYRAGRGRALACADLSGDGIADLAIANGYSNTVSVFLGVGDGSLTEEVQYPTAGNAIAVFVGDLDLDGKADLVTGNGDGKDVSALLNNGDGTFAAHLDHVGTGETGSFAIGDLNGDGYLDLGRGDYSPRGATGIGQFSLIPGNGDGTFAPTADFLPYAEVCAVATGDLTGDGRLDLVGGTSSGISVLLGQEDGELMRGSDQESNGFCPLALGDVNGDGKLDAATTTWRDQQAVVTLRFGSGDGTFR